MHHATTAVVAAIAVWLTILASLASLGSGLLITDEQRKKITFQQPLQTIHGVPKIIHQTWKTTDLPPAFAKWSQSWQDCLPDWEYKLHTDQDNHDIFAKHFPDLLAMYKNFSEPIKRVDAVRYAYLAIEGGIYVDMDIECLRDPISVIEQSVNAAPVVLACEGCHQVSNAFMMAAIGSGRSFFRQVVQALPQSQEDVQKRSFEERILYGTGPMFLTTFLDKKGVDWHSHPGAISDTIGPDGTHIAVLDDSLVFGLKWDDEAAKAACTNRKACSDKFPEAIAVSHWTASWKNKELPAIVEASIGNRKIDQISNTSRLHGNQIDQCDCLDEFLFLDQNRTCGITLERRFNTMMAKHKNFIARTKMTECFNVYLASCDKRKANNLTDVEKGLAEVFDGGSTVKNGI